MSDNPQPGDRLQTEIEREVARRLDHFSVVTFGYDRGSKDPAPRVVIEWGHKQIAREASRRKAMTAVITGAATTLMGAASWPLIQYFVPWLR